MKISMKTIAFSIFFILLHNIAVSGTVDNATLSPASSIIKYGPSQVMTFSAINDKPFALKDYHIKIKYDDGLTVTNLAASPSAIKAEVYPNRNLIELKWEDIPLGTELKATFFVSGGIGTYNITPDSIVFRDYNHNRYIGTCNTSTIAIRYELVPPSPSKNIYSISGDGYVKIIWDPNIETDITGYDIYRSDDSISYTKIGSAAYPYFIDSGVQNGMTYYRGGRVCLDSLKQFLSDKLLRLIPLPAS